MPRSSREIVRLLRILGKQKSGEATTSDFDTEFGDMNSWATKIAEVANEAADEIETMLELDFD